jgi:hypothetical protein
VVNTYKLIKTESGCTLIFLHPDGSEHAHHRWIFSSKEFNASADRAAGCFPTAYSLACAHARGDAHELAKPDGSTVLLTSYVYAKHSDHASASEDRLEVLHVGLEYRLYEVRAQLGFYFNRSSPMREDYTARGGYTSLAEAAQALCSFLEEFDRDESAWREATQEWQSEQDRETGIV